MKHRMGFNKLSKNVSHRQALYRSMATALFKYERIRTTKPKAKEIRRVAEKMISRARTDSVHNRRIIGKRIRDKAVLAKLFTDIAPRFTSRPGGYTRILKLGPRYGDASEMVLLELVERTQTAPRRRKKESTKAEEEPAKEGAEPKEGAADQPKKAAKAPKPAKAKAGERREGSPKAGTAKTGTARTAAAPGSSAAKPKAKGPAADAQGKPAAGAKRQASAGKAAPAKKAQPAKADQPEGEAPTSQTPAAQTPEAEASEQT